MFDDNENVEYWLGRKDDAESDLDQAMSDVENAEQEISYWEDERWQAEQRVEEARIELDEIEKELADAQGRVPDSEDPEQLGL